MSQYTSRIHIKVSSPSVWGKFIDEDDASFDLAELANTKNASFIIDGEWSVFEDELHGIVYALAETLGEDGIIIADTTNINVDPYNFCTFFLGDEVRAEEFGIDYFGEDFDGKSEMHFETDINNVPAWLSYGEFEISPKEAEVLFRCGIAVSDGYVDTFSTELEIPAKIYLRETSFENRADIIEKLQLDEDVYLVQSQDTLDQMRLEVMSHLGSVGFLPSDVSEKLTPIWRKNRLEYNARIVEVVPLSKRNPHAKSAIVAISIEAEISSKKQAYKTTSAKTSSTAFPEEKTQRTELKAQCSPGVSGKIFVVTGDLVHYSSREELKSIIEKGGGKLTGSVSSKTTALITNFPDSGTTKIRKAVECGVEIISEDDFIAQYLSTPQAQDSLDVDGSENKKASRDVEEAVISIDEEQQLAAKALQEEADRKRQEEAAAQVRALEMVRKAAEEEKKRKETSERKRLEEEERKRKELEELKHREEEEHRRQAVEEAERKRKEEAERIRQEEARRLAEEKYTADLKAWEQNCEDIKKQREQAVVERIAAERVSLESAAQQTYKTAIQAATKRKTDAQRAKADAEMRLGKLGIFNFAEKKSLRETIENAEKEIYTVNIALSTAKQAFEKALTAVPVQLSAKESEIITGVEQDYPLPAKPEK